MFSVLRVNWLRAKARRDRWVEEKKLLYHEVRWTRQYFIFVMNKWIARAGTPPIELSFYALRQADNWRKLVDLADSAIAKCGGNV